MDSYQRHQIIFKLLNRLLTPGVCRLFRLRHEDVRVTGPMLLISNHVSAWDPILVGMSLREKHAYFVASSALAC